MANLNISINIYQKSSHKAKKKISLIFNKFIDQQKLKHLKYYIEVHIIYVLNLNYSLTF